MKLQFQPPCCRASHRWLGFPRPRLNPWVSLAPGKVLVFLQLLMGCVLHGSKEFIFYSLGSFLWLVYWTIQLWMTVVGCLYKVERDAVQTIDRMFLADFWGIRLLWSYPNCIDSLSSWVLLVSGTSCSSEVNQIQSNYRIWAKECVLVFYAQTSLLCCGFILM